jgi:hypothetical protein
MQQHGVGATSTRADGTRPCWQAIWKSLVPRKVELLAWKICRNALATEVNMATRGMRTSSLCQICGMEPEDSFHIFMRCPHARALWMAMKEVRDLPGYEMIIPTGKEWLLQLLNIVNEN